MGQLLLCQHRATALLGVSDRSERGICTFKRFRVGMWVGGVTLGEDLRRQNKKKKRQSSSSGRVESHYWHLWEKRSPLRFSLSRAMVKFASRQAPLLCPRPPSGKQSSDGPTWSWLAKPFLRLTVNSGGAKLRWCMWLF